MYANVTAGAVVVADARRADLQGRDRTTVNQRLERKKKDDRESESAKRKEKGTSTTAAGARLLPAPPFFAVFAEDKVKKKRERGNAQDEENADCMLRSAERLERVLAGGCGAHEDGIARLGRGQEIEQRARERRPAVR